jgi:mono/diheme cytochrome c family protein
MTARRIALALVALVLVTGVAACGGDDGDSGATDTTTTETTTDTTTTDETTAASGRDVFVGECASCHTFEDAGATGAIGPNLDESTADEAAVEAQVRSGGGGMPAFEGQLSDEEIQAVAGYVVAERQG